MGEISISKSGKSPVSRLKITFHHLCKFGNILEKGSLMFHRYYKHACAEEGTENAYHNEKKIENDSYKRVVNFL